MFVLQLFIHFNLLMYRWIGAINMNVQIAQFLAFSISGVYPEMDLLDHIVILGLIFLGTAILFSIAIAPSHIPTSNAHRCQFHILTNTLFFGVFGCIGSLLLHTGFSLIAASGYSSLWWLLLL